VVLARGFSDPAPDPPPEFGLYLDERWRGVTAWPSMIVEWPDFGVPANPENAGADIARAFDEARRGSRVEVACHGGIGRTGTVLACMAILAGVPPAGSVGWVREAYRSGAVETDAQIEFVTWFGTRAGAGVEPG
jgi:hypothetical protein